ncbi:hypothetical protein DPEC_G00106040 [Dallia pectoralis]|uniref:Uncharacterized protein n=1 Tax=Dallia pectoralis TaxID=75939 RepID=A0ACC2GXP8_DALPE|nr:hypothetical protein DPEC_G00106040 [Dallia pectoralis]
MPRQKQYQPQRVGLQSHRGKAPTTVTLATEPRANEKSCGGDTGEPHRRPSLAPPPVPHDPTPTSLNPQGLDPTSTPPPPRFPRDPGPGASEPCQDPMDKDLSLSSILALLCGVNPLQSLGSGLAASPPVGVQGLGRDTVTCPPVGSSLGGHGRMQGGRREGEGDSSPPLGLLPDVPPLSQHALQLSALAQRVAKNSLSSPSSFSFTSPSCAMSSEQPVSGSLQGGRAELDVWPSHRSSWAGREGRLSPDSAIQRLRVAAANAALHNKSADPTSSPSLSSGGVVLQEEVCLTFDPSLLTTPSSASSTLTALSQKVSQSGPGSKVTGAERSELSLGQKLPNASSFLSLLSRSSPALQPQSSSGAGENQRGLSPVARPEEETQTRVGNQAVPPFPCKNQGSAQLPQMESYTTPRSAPLPLDTLLNSSPLGEGRPGAQTVVYQCPICGLQMKRRSYWRRHMSVHTGLKSQQCQICPFRCARKDNLTAHMKVHIQKEKGEEFQCNLCPFTSPRHFSLKLHMRSLDTGLSHSSCAPPLASASVRLELLRPVGEGEPEGNKALLHSLSPHPPSLAPRRNRRKARTPPYTTSGQKRRTHTPLTKTPLMVPMATSLFSPDITTKTASDLLIKLSEATQKSELKPGSLVKQEAQEEGLVLGQQHQGAEPGLALSPDGPGASPEPPTPLPTPLLTPTEAETERGLLEQDINVTVASELLRRLSEKQEVVAPGLTVKEEVEPIDVDPITPSMTPDPALTLKGREDPIMVKHTPPAPLIPKEEDLFQKELFSQDISVKMASALLFQLSEKVCKANELKESRSFSFPVEKQPSAPCGTDPKPHSSDHVQPAVGCKYRCPVCLYQAQCQTNLNHHLASHTAKTSGWDYYYRCHMCGFELEGRSQFLSHMMEHSEWERDAFSLRCSVCDHSTNEERAMRLHATSHTLSHTARETGSEDYPESHLAGSHAPKDAAVGRDSPHTRELRCPLCEFSTSRPVSMVTHMRSSHSATDQHLCCICQRSFPGQPELQAHIRGHRQGNQYRCERVLVECSAPYVVGLFSRRDASLCQANRAASRILLNSPGSKGPDPPAVDGVMDLRGFGRLSVIFLRLYSQLNIGVVIFRFPDFSKLTGHRDRATRVCFLLLGNKQTNICNQVT